MQPRLTRLALSVLMVLTLGGALGPFPAQARTHATRYDGVSTFTRLSALVRAEYRVPVPQSRLVGGALNGLRVYLRGKHLNDRMVPAAGTRALSVADFRQAYQRIVHRYPKIDQRELSYSGIRGMLDSLGDPYTVFLDPEEYRGLIGQLNGGNFGGLGIYIELDDKNHHQLTVVEPMDGTPAMTAGIRPRDAILAIDGRSTKGMALEDATRLLRGPVGSTVTLTIRREGVQEPLKVPVKRAIIHVKTLSYKILDDQVGYIKLRVFGETANDEIDEAFRAFDRAGVKGYILDLRNNGGGYITAALDVASKYLATGSRVVSVAERGSPEIVYNSRPNMRHLLPIVVLVNQYSASASEITAGAIKDLKSGTLVGVKTFGKGSVQKIFPLPDGSAVKITTAHYHTPLGHDINKKGIMPDVDVPMNSKSLDTPADVQLKTAVELIEQKIAQRAKVLASRSRLDVTPVRSDAIRVKSSDDEFQYIQGLKGADGGTFQIQSQTLVNQEGHYYDEVIVKNDKTGETRTLYFQTDFFDH